MSLIVYFSSRSENTHRFVQRLGLPAVRIPLNEREHLRVDEPYILIVPSYGGGYTFCGCRCQNSLTPLRTVLISSGV
ncbi:class Ib ribonucleoside-diphosphate reductase assembly flavoprotein NrdI, partial [Klebsiella pneumoniae]|uniref:class Ib ribonucleoside-diphosphate reductase assembly flavoprotein NrdI n=1 Tax=Klebsiella pneumoniae TaxID=573 RepID=UPI00200F053C